LQLFHLARLEESLWDAHRYELAAIVGEYRKSVRRLREDLVRQLAGRLEGKVA
jgi:hypothetical protein